MYLNVTRLFHEFDLSIIHIQTDHSNPIIANKTILKILHYYGSKLCFKLTTVILLGCLKSTRLVYFKIDIFRGLGCPRKKDFLHLNNKFHERICVEQTVNCQTVWHRNASGVFKTVMSSRLDAFTFNKKCLQTRHLGFC